jgi:hypothetical protein
MGVNICVILKHTWAMLEVIVRRLCHVQLMPASMAMLLASLITGTLNLQFLYQPVQPKHMGYYGQCLKNNLSLVPFHCGDTNQFA